MQNKNVKGFLGQKISSNVKGFSGQRKYVKSMPHYGSSLQANRLKLSDFQASSSHFSGRFLSLVFSSTPNRSCFWLVSSRKWQLGRKSSLNCSLLECLRTACCSWSCDGFCVKYNHETTGIFVFVIVFKKYFLLQNIVIPNLIICIISCGVNALLNYALVIQAEMGMQ